MSKFMIFVLMVYSIGSFGQQTPTKQIDIQHMLYKVSEQANLLEQKTSNKNIVDPIVKEYIEILEKTNSQLGLWSNPYGILVSALSVLLALLAIGVAFALYKQGAEHRKQLREEKDQREKQFDDFIKKGEKMLSTTVDKILSDSKEQYDRWIGEYKAQLVNASPKNIEEIKQKIAVLEKQRADVAIDTAKTITAELPNTLASLAGLSTNIVHKCSSCNFGFKVIIPRMSFVISQGDQPHVTCPKCGNVDLV